jgi:uncharacterized cofD-like protein
MGKNPSVVVIGGGTGTFTVLNSLRDQPVQLTALMTMVDDGGSNKILRDEFGLLPTSGIRQAMVALSGKQSVMRDLFMYRYHRGTGISGMTFGNLFLAAMADILGSQEKAIAETSRFLGVKGNILPISFDDVQLLATYENGSQVLGEHRIDMPEHDGTKRIIALQTIPAAKISPKAREAILGADMIIMGPGDFYTNTIVNLIVEGVAEAIQKSSARLVFIINLMTKYGEAYNYKASDYLRDLGKFLPLSRVNYVVINNDTNYPREALDKYKNEKAQPVMDDLNKTALPDKVKVIRTPLVSQTVIQPEKGDAIRRSMIRHDERKLGKLLLQIYNDKLKAND